MIVLLIESFVKILLVIAGLMAAAAYLVLLERRVAAWIQDRRGPNRVGIPLTRIRLFGLGQPAADGVKFIFKEEFTPSHVDKLLYFLAPMLMLIAAIGVFAVIPFGSVLPADVGIEGVEQPIALCVAPGLDVGLLYIFAVSGIAVYGVVLGSWASNNKYAFFGGMRAAAQLISHEIPLGLGILAVVLMAGSLRLEAIIGQQASTGVWNIFVQPLGFIVFATAACAEAGRLPFDLAESEQELVGGYHTEYSGMKLMMYLVSEFLHMIAASFLIVLLYLGGWHLWGVSGSGTDVTWLTAILRVGILLGKVLAVVFCFMLIRWSWPRFRFDQLMSLAWKVMLPLGMVNLVVVAVWVEYGQRWTVALAVAGWTTLFLGWLVVGRVENSPSPVFPPGNRRVFNPAYQDKP